MIGDAGQQGARVITLLDLGALMSTGSNPYPHLTSRQHALLRIYVVTLVVSSVGFIILCSIATEMIGFTILFILALLALITFVLAMRLHEINYRHEVRVRRAELIAICERNDARHAQLRENLQRAKRTGDPLTMMTVAEATLVELDDMRVDFEAVVRRYAS